MNFFKGKEGPPLPTKDLLSWLFDDPNYGVNEPVLTALIYNHPSADVNTDIH